MKKLLTRIKVPHVFIFLSAIILFSSILTYIIPSGAYERTTKRFNKLERTVVVPDTYQPIPKHYSVKGLVLGENIEGKASPTSLLGLFSAIPKGMNQAASLIFYVFIIGAVFNLIRHTGTVNVFVYRLLKKFRKSPGFLVLILYAGISMGSTFIGFGPELIPMIPIFMMLSKEMGYDRAFGMAILMVPLVIGWATAITNPFTVQIAQQIAELPIGSGMMFRVVMYIVCAALGFIFMMYYGNKVKKDRSKSVMPDDPFILDEDVKLEDTPVQRKHIWIAVTAIILFGTILFAVQTMGWGLIEMTGGFFTVGLLTILISGMSGSEAMKAFVRGLEVMIIPALVIGFARGILVVMQEGLIIDSILYHTANILQNMPDILAIEGMYFFQTFLNFFIPSASGQAMVSMPLMVPLADLLGISRQMAVLAFISGDGFSNMVIPTSGILMAVLGISKIPYEKWIKFVLPLFLTVAFVAGVFLVIAMYIGY
jgi:uncharacterized ion transporter superfamily protein YfcC